MYFWCRLCRGKLPHQTSGSRSSSQYFRVAIFHVDFRNCSLLYFRYRLCCGRLPRGTSGIIFVVVAVFLAVLPGSFPPYFRVAVFLAVLPVSSSSSRSSSQSSSVSSYIDVVSITRTSRPLQRRTSSLRVSRGRESNLPTTASQPPRNTQRSACRIINLDSLLACRRSAIPKSGLCSIITT